MSMLHSYFHFLQVLLLLFLHFCGTPPFLWVLQLSLVRTPLPQKSFFLPLPSLPPRSPHPLQPGRVATSTGLARNPLSIGSSPSYSVNPIFSDALCSVVKAGEDPSPIWDGNLLKECQRNMLVISWLEQFIGIQYFLFLISECLLWEI